MEWINLIKDAALVVISSIVSYFVGRRKSTAETISIEHQNMQNILNIYKVEFEAMNKRIDNYVNKIELLENKVKQVVQENVSLRGVIEEFENKFGKKKKQ